MQCRRILSHSSTHYTHSLTHSTCTLFASPFELDFIQSAEFNGTFFVCGTLYRMLFGEAVDGLAGFSSSFSNVKYQQVHNCASIHHTITHTVECGVPFRKKCDIEFDPCFILLITKQMKHERWCLGPRPETLLIHVNPMNICFVFCCHEKFTNRFGDSIYPVHCCRWFWCCCLGWGGSGGCGLDWSPFWSMSKNLHAFHHILGSGTWFAHQIGIIFSVIKTT